MKGLQKTLTVLALTMVASLAMATEAGRNPRCGMIIRRLMASRF